MLNSVKNKGIIWLSIALVLVTAMILFFITFTSEGKTIVSSLVTKEKPQTIINGDVYNIKQKAIINLTLETKEQYKDVLNTFNVLKKDIKKDIEIDDNNKEKVDIITVKNSLRNKIDYKLDTYTNALDKLNQIRQMNDNSDNVIKVGVDRIDKYKLFYNNIDFRKKFFLAKLDELKENVSDSLLLDISEKETKEIYAQLLMIKSISYYLSYNPDKAYKSYILAKKAFPTLKVISDLKEEYKVVYPKDALEIKYAYVLVASVTKSKQNMEKTADKILSPTKAYKFRNLGYNLYLSVNQKEVRVYTIVEYHSKLELDKKFLEIEKIEKTSSLYSKTKDIPIEFRLKEMRKKIYVFRSSDRQDDIRLVNKLKKQNISHVEAKGRWHMDFGIYAIYYDGNAYDKNDLTNILDLTRDAVGSQEVKLFAYQQSNGKAIKDLFNDKNLKYLIVLERNTYIKK